MSIALPSSPACSGFSFAVLDFGGDITPSLGGPAQRINRLGSRYQLQLQVPPLASAIEGRVWTARLERAKQIGAVYPVPLDGFSSGAPGTPV
ncbi:hypothetical protein ACKI1O_49520, partial [Streptomyces scabiei]